MARFIAFVLMGVLLLIGGAVLWQVAKKVDFSQFKLPLTVNFQLPEQMKQGAQEVVQYAPEVKTDIIKEGYVSVNGVSVKVPDGVQTKDVSSTYQKVKISSVRAPSINGTGSSFYLTANLVAGEQVDITGWKIKTNKGVIAFIPDAILDLNPYGLYKKGDIVLKSGNTVRVWGEKTTYPGNLRPNKCAGYLNELYKNTNDPFPSNCPTMYEKSELVNFPGRCQTLIMSIGNCVAPSPQKINEIASVGDSACRAFIDRFNYGECYKRFSNTADFLSNEWRVWLGDALNFDREHDRIFLLDKNDKVVSEYIY